MEYYYPQQLPKSNSSTIIVVLLLLSGIGAGYYFMIMKNDKCSTESVKYYNNEGIQKCLLKGETCYTSSKEKKGVIAIGSLGKLECVDEGNVCDVNGKVIDYSCKFEETLRQRNEQIASTSSNDNSRIFRNNKNSLNNSLRNRGYNTKFDDPSIENDAQRIVIKRKETEAVSRAVEDAQRVEYQQAETIKLNAERKAAQEAEDIGRAVEEAQRVADNQAEAIKLNAERKAREEAEDVERAAEDAQRVADNQAETTELANEQDNTISLFE